VPINAAQERKNLYHNTRKRGRWRFLALESIAFLQLTSGIIPVLPNANLSLVYVTVYYFVHVALVYAQLHG